MSTVPSSKSRIVPAPDLFPAGASGKCPVPAPRDRESQKRSRTQTPSLQRLSTPHRTPSNSSGIYERTGRSAASIAIILPRASFSDMQCRPRDRRANARISRQHRTSHRKLPVHKGIIPGTHRSLGSQLPNKRGFTFPAQRAHSSVRTQQRLPIYIPPILGPIIDIIGADRQSIIQ